MTHPGFGQLFNLLHFPVRHDVVVSDDAGVVPLVFLLHRTNHVFWMSLVVMVPAEETALPARSLKTGTMWVADDAKQTCVWKRFTRLTILRPSPRHSRSYFFLSGR